VASASRKRAIPVIADAHVDKEFGTGVLKVTPAHDKADFEIGQRHGLPVIDVLTPTATLNDCLPAGVRTAWTASPRARRPPRCSRKWAARERGGLREQRRLLRTRRRADRAAPFDAVVPQVPARRGRPRPRARWHILPPGALEKGLRPLDGKPAGLVHQPPALVGAPHPGVVSQGQSATRSRRRRNSTPRPWRPATCRHDAPADPENWVQDPDVLDTWFSSWLWPFATMGWPGDRRTPTQRKFYPTTDLVTGPDIIFFWVARMIMAGYEYENAPAFKNVYFTGIIRDKQGRKMSKSLGNSPDPLDLIAKYGADGLRFGISASRRRASGQDVRFDEKQIDRGPELRNKLWNACRFRQMARGRKGGERHL
jgi:valyl-tRNA synthetase